MTVYEIVTNKIIEQIDMGIVPWHKPWVGDSEKFNRITKSKYSFLNQLLLPYGGEYASLKQWNKIGGRIRSGEKGHIIVFWSFITKKVVNDDGIEEERTVPFLRYHTVFHISQVEEVQPLKQQSYIEKSQNAERIIKDYFEREKCRLFIQSIDSAYYDPSNDEIHIPKLNQFFETNEYYSTLFHEMTHSTGLNFRLNRLSKDSYCGIKDYSREELIAEIGSAMLCNICGLDSKRTFRNSIAYLQNWKQAFANDDHLIVSAASKAEKAVKFILDDIGS